MHEDRAAAPSIWQVLLFAEAPCERVKLHWPVSPAAPMRPADFYKSFICSAVPPLQPRDLLGVCIAEPWPRFFSLFLNWFTFHASLMSSCNLWWPSAIYLRKEMHPEQFTCSLFCLPTCSCFEEISCPWSKLLVPWWSLSEAVSNGCSWEGSFSLTPSLLWGLSELHHLVDEWGAQSLSCSQRVFQIQCQPDASSAK